MEDSALNPPLLAAYNLESIIARNETRKAIKAWVSAGPWFVKTNTYRGYGTKYEVRRKVEPKFEGDIARDETVVPEGLYKEDKEFIAFSRNDTPEHDIDMLVAKVNQLQAFEAERNQLVAYITQLEANKRELETKVEQLETEKHEVMVEFQQYISQTESLYLNASVIRKALEYYADEKHWDWQFVSHPMLKDAGQTARDALANSNAGYDLLARLQELEQREALIQQQQMATMPPHTNGNGHMVLPGEPFTPALGQMAP